MRLVRLSPALLCSWFLAGCAAGWDIGGQEGEDAQPDTAADTDADTDTVVDTDTDADTDTGDTGGAGVLYVGPFTIDATDAAGAADRCAGTVSLRVIDGAAAGTGACSFAGALAPRFPDGLGATVLGTVAEDDTATGTLNFSTGASGDLAWTGALTTNLAGTFAGSLTTADTTLTVTGALDAAPE